MEEPAIYDSQRQTKATEWELKFVLSRVDGKPITQESIERFYDKLIDLVESHGL